MAQRLGGVIAIDELIEVKLQGEDTDMLSRFAAHLRAVFDPGENGRPSSDNLTQEIAAVVLGNLVRHFGPLAADVVESEVRSRATQTFT